MKLTTKTNKLVEKYVKGTAFIESHNENTIKTDMKLNMKDNKYLSELEAFEETTFFYYLNTDFRKYYFRYLLYKNIFYCGIVEKYHDDFGYKTNLDKIVSQIKFIQSLNVDDKRALLYNTELERDYDNGDYFYINTKYIADKFLDVAKTFNKI